MTVHPVHDTSDVAVASMVLTSALIDELYEAGVLTVEQRLNIFRRAAKANAEGTYSHKEAIAALFKQIAPERAGL